MSLSKQAAVRSDEYREGKKKEQSLVGGIYHRNTSQYVLAIAIQILLALRVLGPPYPRGSGMPDLGAG